MDEMINKNTKYLTLNRQPQEYFEYNKDLKFENMMKLKGNKVLVITQGAPTVEALTPYYQLIKKIVK